MQRFILIGITFLLIALLATVIVWFLLQDSLRIDTNVQPTPPEQLQKARDAASST